jgi:hypothetical protein
MVANSNHIWWHRPVISAMGESQFEVSPGKKKFLSPYFRKTR